MISSNVILALIGIALGSLIMALLLLPEDTNVNILQSRAAPCWCVFFAGGGIAIVLAIVQIGIMVWSQ